MGIAPDLHIVCAYILGYVNACRDMADLVAFHEMRICASAAQSLDRAANEPLRGRTFRDEHVPGAVRHIKEREYRLDNGYGERGFNPKPTRDQWIRQWSQPRGA
jgi:hypothetical protein